MVRQVFFDFFGTLVEYDARPFGKTGNAPWEFARRAGSALGEHQVDRLWQQAWEELEAQAVLTGREYSMTEVATRFNALLEVGVRPKGEVEHLINDYLDSWSAGVQPAAGLRRCLANLSGRYGLAVVSNTHDRDLVPGLMARLSIGEYFGSVITSVDVGWRKPRPEIFQAALDTQNAQASEVLFVGDNVNADAVGSTAMGMRAVLVAPPAGGLSAVQVPVVPLTELSDYVAALPSNPHRPVPDVPSSLR